MMDEDGLCFRLGWCFYHSTEHIDKSHTYSLYKMCVYSMTSPQDCLKTLAQLYSVYSNNCPLLYIQNISFN